MANMLTKFGVSREKMAAFRPMIDNYGIETTQDAEWPNNVLSQRTVVYKDGKIAKRGVKIRQWVDSDELALCQRLALSVGELAKHVHIPSEASSTPQPFFITNNHGDGVPAQIDAELIRKRFGGTIFPNTEITVEPLVLDGAWLDEIVEEDHAEMDLEYQQFAAGWAAVVEWFHAQSEIQQPVFARVGDDRSMWKLDQQSFPAGTDMIGSVFPRLLVGLTLQGSLVGLMGYAVLT